MRKTLILVATLSSLPTILSAQEPQGGTLIQMSSIGLLTLLVTTATFNLNPDSTLAKALGISKWLKKRKH